MPPATSSSVLRRRRDEGDTATLPPAAPNDPRAIWREAFHAVRAETVRRAAPLSAEDQVVQSMPDASPAKWHRAHTTWFFEQFLLVPHLTGYRVFDAQFAYLFNSYYVAAGPRHARPRRGLITRPDCERVAAFRAHVDAGVERLLASAEDSQLAEVVRIVEIGLHHEQQHQLRRTRWRRLMRPIGARRARRPRRANLLSCPGASTASVSRAKDTVSTTRGRPIRCCSSRPALPAAW